MGRVTTTAGGEPAGATRGPEAGDVAADADLTDPDAGCVADVPLFDCGACAAGIPRCVDFVAAGALLGAVTFGC